MNMIYTTEYLLIEAQTSSIILNIFMLANMALKRTLRAGSFFENVQAVCVVGFVDVCRRARSAA
jgi:hypothetical protein